MIDYKYIIVGGGMTADSAVTGIRDRDKSGTIAVFSEEKDPPYNRPPLSKGLWKGEKPETIWRDTSRHKIDFFPSAKIVSINPAGKSVKSGDGRVFTYDKLLLATGGTVRRLPFGGDDVIYFRTFEDYTRLRSAEDEVSGIVVIGGGFIGSEVAAALAMNGKKVALILPEDGIGARVYPADLSSFLVRYYSEKGVSVLTGDTVVALERRGSEWIVGTKSGKKIPAGAVVAGLGITPNDGLAKSAGLAVDNGIVVDAFLRATNHGIYSAGDVANFYNASLNNRMRVEHEDNANTMGLIAGHNMAGSQEAYDHLPFFYSDLFDLGYEAVGELDSRMEIIEDWVEEYRKGVVYYHREGVVRGVLLWNTWGK
ncbi:MAG TPA: FAD-dependent oxidoreductase, partial [Candidatus Kryptobacter bacterium]|nr:FAD-dependent oxidoreductase [Candidatus Kryptobacter bacterium]